MSVLEFLIGWKTEHFPTYILKYFFFAGILRLFQNHVIILSAEKLDLNQNSIYNRLTSNENYKIHQFLCPKYHIFEWLRPSLKQIRKSTLSSVLQCPLGRYQNPVISPINHPILSKTTKNQPLCSSSCHFFLFNTRQKKHNVCIKVLRLFFLL